MPGVTTVSGSLTKAERSLVADGKADLVRDMRRTFQDATLFPDLTVRETVQVAVESRAHARLLAVGLGLPKARRVERA